MKHSLRTWVLACLLLAVTPYGFAEVAIVVNQANTASISTEDVEKIFLGKSKTFADGSAALPINLVEGKAEREAFTQTILGRTSSQLKAYWSKLVFTGKGSPPKELASDAEVIEAIKADRTAIGYVNAASLKGELKVVHSF